jgi:hypothetical protein
MENFSMLAAVTPNGLIGYQFFEKGNLFYLIKK